MGEEDGFIQLEHGLGYTPFVGNCLVLREDLPRAMLNFKSFYPFIMERFSFQSVDEILWCVHSNETSSPVLLHGTICFSIFNIMNFGLLRERRLQAGYTLFETTPRPLLLFKFRYKYWKSKKTKFLAWIFFFLVNDMFWNVCHATTPYQ